MLKDISRFLLLAIDTPLGSFLLCRGWGRGLGIPLFYELLDVSESRHRPIHEASDKQVKTQQSMGNAGTASFQLGLNKV